MALLGPTRPWLHWRRESIIDVYQLALGVFLFISPWLFAFTRSTVRVETWAVGIALIAMSAGALIAFSDWEEWINLALAVWLIVAPWALGFAHTTAMRVSVGVGIVVAFLALLDLWLIRYGDEAQPGAGGHA
jgi:SPW repeat-containing protein